MKFDLKNISPLLIYFLVIVACSPYLFLILNYALNIPHGDDFYAIVGFFKFLEDKNTFSEIIGVFFYTEKEHVNLVARVIAYVKYQVTGELNFRYYTLIGNLFLLGIVGVFYKKLKSLGHSAITFIPFLIIVLNISYWEISIKGLMAIQHFGVLFFSLLAFYIIDKYRDYKFTFLAFISCLFATYSFGNGLLSLLIIPLVLLIQRRKKEFIVWSVLTGVLLVIMFIEVSGHTEYGLRLLPLYIKIRFFFNLFAGILGGWYLYSSFFVGVAIFTGALFLLYRKSYFKINPFYLSIVLFVVGSYLLTTIQRSDRGLMVSFIARYPIYSSLIIGVIYLMILDQFELIKKHWVVVTVLAIFINVNSWFTRFDNGVKDRIELSKQGLQNWVCTKKNFWLRDGIDSPYNTTITNQLTWFYESGYYKPPYHLASKHNCDLQK